MKQTALKCIYHYIKKHLLAISLLCVISGAIAFSFILLAIVSSSILDIAVGTRDGRIVLQCSFIAGLILFQGILNILGSNIRAYVSGKIEIKIKEELFLALMKKQFLQITKMHSGEVLNRFTSDVQVVVSGVVSIVPQTISLATKLFAGLFVMLNINFTFTIVIIICGISMCFFSRFYSIRIKYLHKGCQESDGKTRSFLQECIENILVLKSFSNWGPIMGRLSEFQTRNFKAKMKRNAVSNAANTSAYVALTSGYFITLAWGAFQISSKTMTFGTLTAFLQIIEQIKAPFRYMSGITNQYYSMLASAERLQELDELEDEVALDIASEELNEREIYEGLNYICFENVSFAYEKEIVFNVLNLIINKGDFIAVAGNSGAGKSTLIKLLLGLVYPDSGQIYIHTLKDKLKICNETRKLFAYVPQTNMILSGTIVTVKNSLYSKLENSLIN